MADSLKPWAWEKVGEGGWNLVDADGYYLVFANRVKGFVGGDPKRPAEIPSTETRERIALAPLMEGLLREYFEKPWVVVDWEGRVRDLLRRIDAAK